MIRFTSHGSLTSHSSTAPFDVGGDVILRSKDNVDFHTFKMLLVMASDVFSSIFEVATGDEVEDELPVPVVRMDAVESGVLRELLLFCHPGQRCEFSRLQEVVEVAEMYQLCEVTRRAMKERLRLAITPLSPTLLKEIRRVFSGDEDRSLAAEYAMKFPDYFGRVAIGYQMISYADLQAVNGYRQRCCKAAHRVGHPGVDHFDWIPDEFTDNYGWFDDLCGSHSNCDSGPNCYFHHGDKNKRCKTRGWWHSYVHLVADEVAINPDPSIAMQGWFDVALKRGSRCPICERNLEHLLTRFAAIFASRMDFAMAKVRA